MSDAGRRRVGRTGRCCRSWSTGRAQSGGKERCATVLPIILGSDLAGIVDSVGKGVIQFKPGDEVFGVTNKQFFGAYAEYAVASAQMVAAKPRSLSFVEAASVSVVAVTAYQMLLDYAQMKAGQAVLIHGAAGQPAFPRRLHDRETPVEAEEKHGGPLCRRCARRL
jgi:D-arabinose 1-dehydrogenase-like Zn-dependent alcohol dehydrogenase